MSHSDDDDDPESQQLCYHDRCNVRVVQACLIAQNFFVWDTPAWSEEEYKQSLLPDQFWAYVVARRIWFECKGDLAKASARASQR